MCYWVNLPTFCCKTASVIFENIIKTIIRIHILDGYVASITTKIAMVTPSVILSGLVFPQCDIKQQVDYTRDDNIFCTIHV